MTDTASRAFDFSGLDDVLKDPQQAALYLEECYIEGNGDMALFQEALRDVAKAQKGGVTSVAQSAGVSRTSLYKSLCKEGKPSLQTITKLVDALGFEMKISFEPKNQMPA